MSHLSCMATPFLTDNNVQVQVRTWTWLGLKSDFYRKWTWLGLDLNILKCGVLGLDLTWMFSRCTWISFFLGSGLGLDLTWSVFSESGLWLDLMQRHADLDLTWYKDMQTWTWLGLEISWTCTSLLTDASEFVGNTSAFLCYNYIHYNSHEFVIVSWTTVWYVNMHSWCFTLIVCRPLEWEGWILLWSLEGGRWPALTTANTLYGGTCSPIQVCMHS